MVGALNRGSQDPAPLAPPISSTVSCVALRDTAWRLSNFAVLHGGLSTRGWSKNAIFLQGGGGVSVWSKPSIAVPKTRVCLTTNIERRELC